MIGRGTRIYENLFGEGQDKKEFAIFDCYKNFQFFEMHAKGYEPKPQKTSVQLRFEIMCSLLEIFKQKGELNICEAFAAKLKGDIEELPENSIKIKKNRKKIEQVKREEYWNNLSEDLIKKLKLEIAPLTKWIEGVDNSDSVAFDNFIYKIMVNNISNDNDIARNRGISFAALFAESYTNFNPNGVDGIFGKMTDDVFELIEPFRAWYIS